MVAHGNEQIEKPSHHVNPIFPVLLLPNVQFAATNFHLHLHGSTPLESLATSDNQSKVMSTETRVAVRCVVVRKASRAQYDVDLDSRLKALFSKGKTLQLIQAEFLGSAVDSGIFEQDTTRASMVCCRLDRSTATKFEVVLGVFELPRVATLVVQQAWVIISLVKEFEDGRKDLGFSEFRMNFNP